MRRAEHFGDLISADHKIPSEESASRNNHRYAVVVQDLATQLLQFYPSKRKTSQETQKSLMKFLEPTRKPKVIYTDNHRPFDKEQTLFLEQLCVATFGLGIVKKEQCSSICTKITPVPLLSETAKTKLVSELHTRGKALELCVLLEVCMSPVVLRRVGVLLHLLCGFKDQATVSFVLDTGLDKREAVRHCQEANTRHFTDDTELIVTPMIHGSTLEMHESSPKAEVVLFRQHPRVCLSLYLCFYSYLCQYFCRWNCRTLLHRDSSPAVFRPLSRFATVLARVDVCRDRVGRAGRAISSLVLVFTFALSRTFLERVNLQPVIICTKNQSKPSSRLP